ncbi:MAG: ABC transporter permease [Phototrophicales bacterium]|nr:ABC transporter permease [Phototrophicales bacterium]
MIHELIKRPLSLLGLIIVGIFVFLALFGSHIAPYKYDEFIRNDAGRVMQRAEPSSAHLLGTDKEGRDVLSRVLWGARDIMLLPGIATFFSVLFGTALGMTIGYYGGWLDEIISRLLDSLLSIPALVLALVMLGLLGASPIGLVLVVVVLYIPIIARVIRSATLNIRAKGYIEIAKLRGESTFYILTREVLPSILPALTVEAALRFSYAIFLVASLGFLGLGVQPPSPDWGRMVDEARGEVLRAPWSLWSPAAAIAILVIGVNLLADGLRRVFRYEGQMR